MFEPFRFAFVQRGLWEVLLLAGAAGLLGTWIVLRGLAFYAHAIGTAAFPGLVLADGLGFAPLLGALGAAGVFELAVAALGRRHRDEYPSFTALVLVGALALGVILASDVFHSGSSVETLLFGSLLLIGDSDLVVAAAATATAVVATLALGPRYPSWRCSCSCRSPSSRPWQHSGPCSSRRCSSCRPRPRGCGRAPFVPGSSRRSRSWPRREPRDCGSPSRRTCHRVRQSPWLQVECSLLPPSRVRCRPSRSPPSCSPAAAPRADTRVSSPRRRRSATGRASSPATRSPSTRSCSRTPIRTSTSHVRQTSRLRAERRSSSRAATALITGCRK